jgi:hypothetical protein
VTGLPFAAHRRVRIPADDPRGGDSWPRAVFLASVALAVGIALAACGSSHPSSRAAVTSYIRAVDRIELGLRAPLAAVTRAGSQLAAAPKRTTLLGNLERVGSERALSGSLVKLEAAKAKLTAMDTPVAARHLGALLLSLTAAEADLTHQLRLLAVFLPRFSAALSPLGPSILSLEKTLGQTQAYGSAAVSALYAAKAQALRRFKGVTTTITGRLDRLQAPRISLPQYRAELTALRGMGTASGRLASALSGGAPGNVRPLLVAFDRAASATRTRSVQRAQTAAIRAYDSATARLNTLAGEVTRERLRLSNSLS